MAIDRITVRVKPELREWFEREAKRQDRSVGYMVSQTMEQRKQASEARDQMIRDAMAEADKGVFVSEEKMNAWVMSWDTENELPPPEPDIFPTEK